MPTLYEKAAQLIFVRLGSNMQPPVPADEDVERMSALLERCPVGGLLLFNGDAERTPAILRELQKKSEHPLLVAADIERGAGQQVAGATIFPHARALGRSEERIEAVARATAREARAAGIHMACMPVADVNRNSRNPIISIRSFGTEPALVGRCAAAYIRGCRSEGLLTAVKHFPGHGNTLDDSHSGLPVVDDNEAVIMEQDIAPFGAAIEAGVDLVMTAHVAFPALDDRRLPATLSSPMLKNLLRERMTFDGPVITDSLLMGGIKGIYDNPGELAAAMVREGVDILLDSQDPEEMIAGLVRAVEDGRLDEQRLDEAYQRVQELKGKMADRFGPSWAEAFPERPSPEERASNEALAAEVAENAISTIVRATPSGSEVADSTSRTSWGSDVTDSTSRGPALFPPDETSGDLCAVLVQPIRSHLDPPEQPLGEALRAAYPDIQYEEVDPVATDVQMRRVREQARKAKRVLVAVVVRPAAWHSYGLQDAQQRFVRRLTEENEVILAALGDPGILESFPAAAATLCTYSDTDPSQEALVRVLSGR